tara:strand:- start:102 stop:434 length:333 start_codon:yes stop_codon:yes gene_type:complete
MRANPTETAAAGAAPAVVAGDGPWAAAMRAKLVAEFAPSALEIEDQSESHRGHGGYREGGETHFHVQMRSASFDGKTRVARQRMVMRVLKDELEARVHALSLSLQAGDEA